MVGTEFDVLGELEEQLDEEASELEALLPREKAIGLRFGEKKLGRAVTCPGPARAIVSRFPRYSNSVASLPLNERTKVKDIATQIVRSFQPGCQSIRTVHLVGHADMDLQRERRQPGFMIKISRERADAVRRALGGLINNRAILSRISWDVSGVGASSLAVPNPQTEPERALNRRVEIWLNGTDHNSPDYIRWVQGCLNQVLGIRLALTGVMEARTVSAIRAFQQRQGLAINGAVNPETLAAFINACGFPLVKPVGPAVKMRPATICVNKGPAPGPDRWVGNGGDNVREDVRETMDRLHLLWSLSNTDYDAEYPGVSAAPLGNVIPLGMIPRTIAAIGRNFDPTLHPAVAAHFLNLSIVDPVGRGQTNGKKDILSLQVSLRALRLLGDSDFMVERTAVSSLTTPTVPDAGILKTVAAITDLKDAAAGGRLGWAPIHSEEVEAGGDRFGGQTFEFSISTLCRFPPQGRNAARTGVESFFISIFVPSGVKPESNKVHVFFAAGSVRGDAKNHVTLHGLRSASDSSEWILISVPGIINGWRTIDVASITACLQFAGRSSAIDELRLTAHSRGASGLRESVQRRFLNRAIDQVVILDASDAFQQASLASVLKSGGATVGKVTQYAVNLPDLSGATNIRLQPDCMRAVAYTRFIQAAQIINPALIIPSQISSQFLRLPPRGSFTAATTSPSDPTNLAKFCADNKSGITRILRNEQAAEGIFHQLVGPPPRRPDSHQLAVLDNSLQLFVEARNLHRICRHIEPLVWSHTFFIQEIAHELVK